MPLVTDIGERRRALGDRLWQEHRDRHDAIRVELCPDAPKLNLHGQGRRYLATLLAEEFPTLDGAEVACRDYLRKRERQARAFGHLGYFGDDAWSRDEWAKRARLDATPRPSVTPTQPSRYAKKPQIAINKRS